MSTFNRERFLLRCVAWIIGVQFAVWGVLGLSCASVFLYKSIQLKSSDPTCEKAGEGFQEATKSSLAILLSLLGGGALALNESRRSKIEEEARLKKEEEGTINPEYDK